MRLFYLLTLFILTKNSPTLKIYLIPHSHDDLGWRKTVQEYFDGSRSDIQSACVNCTISSVVESLKTDQNKTFNFVEVAFIKMWWELQDLTQKQAFKQLLKNKQIEFLNGGVAMNDEACAYYEDIIDNLTYGQWYIKREFGSQFLPKIGWQIDPFGHSRTQAYIYSETGYNAWVFARMDYQELTKRIQDKTLEHVQLVPRGQKIFTFFMTNNYSSPPGFSFEFDNHDTFITEENITQRANELVSYFRTSFRPLYRQDVLMHQIGDDFQWQKADINYSNWDKLIHFINARQEEYGMVLKYGRVSQYMEEIHELKKKYEEKKDDFFPYADEKDSYWTGYFTSRPAQKLFIRESGRFLQTARNLITNRSFQQKDSQHVQIKYQKNLEALSFTLGILQHHDAVSGTEMQRVYWDYDTQLNKAIKPVQQDLIDIFQQANLSQNVTSHNHSFCGWNQTFTDCSPILQSMTQNTNIYLNVYNPGYQGDFTIRIKVPKLSYQAYDQENELNTDVICPYTNEQDCDLYVQVNIESMNQKLIVVKRGYQNIAEAQELIEGAYDFQGEQKVHFESKQHQKFFTLDHIRFSLSYEMYFSYEDEGPKSGAYLFRTRTPTLNSTIPYAFTGQVKQKMYVGKNLVVFTIEDERISSQIKFYANKDSIYYQVPEIETFVNSIDCPDSYGREIVLKIQSHIKNKGDFFTDSNGLDLIKRTINQRKSVDFKVDQLVPSNYYPINAIIGIKDSEKSLFVLNDRSQGGSSLQEGTIELMLHRRLFKDDDKGVREPLNEMDIDNKPLRVKTRHWVVQQGEQKARNIQYRNDLQPLILVSQGENQQFSSEKFPEFLIGVQEQVKLFLYAFGNDFVIRFQNMNADQEVVLDLAKFDLEMTNLTGTKLLESVEEERLYWQDERIVRRFTVLQPLEIRTFIIKGIKICQIE